MKDGRGLKEYKGKKEGTIGVLLIIILIQNPSIYLSATSVTEDDPSQVMKLLVFISRYFFHQLLTE